MADNMGFAIPPEAIVVIICVGVVFICCGLYGIHRVMQPELFAAKDFGERSPEQNEYMFSVRERHLQEIMRDMGARRMPPPVRENVYVDEEKQSEY